MIAATRAARRRVVTELIAAGPVRSQQELMEQLADRGIAVTQATLSRDLNDLGAVKVRTAEGVSYVIDTAIAAAPPDPSRLRRVCVDLLLEANVSENLVVLRTPPGGANLLASAIDTVGVDNVLGTIAGDDTILLITGSSQSAPAVAANLLALSDQQAQEE